MDRTRQRGIECEDHLTRATLNTGPRFGQFALRFSLFDLAAGTNLIEHAIIDTDHLAACIEKLYQDAELAKHKLGAGGAGLRADSELGPVDRQVGSTDSFAGRHGAFSRRHGHAA
jgi:hypothetical protein